MIYAALLFGIFFAVASITVLGREEKDFWNLGIFVLLVVVLFIMAGWRPIGIDGDSNTYLVYYNTDERDLVEPSFIFIKDLAKNVFDSPRAMFVMYALLSVPIKAWGITRMTKLWYLSALIWLSNFYMIHDINQIRVSVGLAIFFVSLPFLVKGERWKYLLLILLACCFHVTCVVLIPLVLLSNKPLGRTWKAILYILPLLGYLLAALNIDPITYLQLPYVQDKLDIYISLRDNGILENDVINLFNPAYILRIVAYYFLLWKYETLKKHTDTLPLLLKIFAISIISFTMLSFMPILSYRIGDMFGCVEILLFPYLVYTVRPLLAGQVVVILFATVKLLLGIFSRGNLNLNS